MTDIEFDITTREIVLAEDDDFSVIENPSVQNGGIIQYSRCAFVNNPMLGIGMEQIINSNDISAAYEMNRWQSQCKNDGATIAKWSGTTNGNNLVVKTQISYL